MPIKLKDKVIITGQPGVARKWPRFAEFFNRVTVVIGIKDDLLQIHLDPKDASQSIWVRRDWVTAAKT